MEIYKKEFKDIWLKAAVLGSLWGSIEIIVGSFFHNIRIPMAGTVLAVLGISLITAFGQNWKDKGLFWRAGLISAVMKSVSPSAILLGPMTGIFLEALLFEFAVIIFGRNIFGYILGGIFALYSVIVHKILTLLIIYGFDLVRITENLYHFIIKQLHIQNVSFFEAFFTLSLFYVVLGLIASISGIYIGNKALNSKQDFEPENEIFLEEEKDKVNPENHQSSLYLLFAHLAFIVIVLAITNMISVEVAFALTLIYSIFTIRKYKRALRYFKRPGFWIQIGIFILISAIFYDGFNHQQTYFTSTGIIAGLKMGIRAILIVVGFSAISSELRNPLIKALLYRKGFWQFYTALGLSFSVLPYLMKHSASPKKILKKPLHSLVKNILDAEFIFNEFKNQKKEKKVIVIKGSKHGGKTTFAEKLSNNLKQKGLGVYGFLAKGTFKNNLRAEFKIFDINTGESKLLCKATGDENQKTVGRFYFNEEGLKFGKEILKFENTKNADFIIIDELGPFELKGKGWSNSIEKLSEIESRTMIWVIRKSLVYDILRRFGITDALIIDIEKDNIDEVIEKVQYYKD